MINVTKPFLPPQEEFNKFITEIWNRNWLTNNGPLVNDLELKLKEYLNLDHLLFLNNGTIALQLAIKSLDLKGEIITTPFSYIATTSSIVWEGCQPVFVDIHPETFNIDPKLIEASITPKTSAILATHVYGNPCDVDAIDKIAKKHKLRVIYDAAHCFGTKYNGKSIFEYGDISTTSFHATKLFHTVEGGAVFTKDYEILKKLEYMRNFGHNGPEDFLGVGINGKNSEVHAAMGLCNLNHVDAILLKRKQDSLYYDQKLKGLNVKRPTILNGADFNYAYYVIVFESEKQVLESIEVLNANWIYPRRYFYPSLNLVNFVKNQSAPVSEEISKRVLCLPLFYDLTSEEMDMIVRLLLKVQNN